MATTSKAKTPAPAETPVPTFEVSESTQAFTNSGKVAKPNPLTEMVAQANEKRNTNFVLSPVATEEMLKQVTTWLRSAATAHNASVRIQWNKDAGTVLFALRDKITRPRKAKDNGTAS